MLIFCHPLPISHETGFEVRAFFFWIFSKKKTLTNTKKLKKRSPKEQKQRTFFTVGSSLVFKYKKNDADDTLSFKRIETNR